jgi:hypothetical protein
MPVRAVLDELLRIGVAKRLENGDIELLSAGAIVPDADDRSAALNVLAQDASDFIASCSHNILATNEKKYYQRATWTDNIPIEKLEIAKTIARKRGLELADEFTNEFSKLDRDITPTSTGTGRARAVFGVYYYEEITDDGTKPESITTDKR